jgi:hypothetical protein
MLMGGANTSNSETKIEICMILDLILLAFSNVSGLAQSRFGRSHPSQLIIASLVSNLNSSP